MLKSSKNYRGKLKWLPLFLYICIMEEKKLHKIEIIAIRIIPMLLALIALLNTLLSCFDIDVPLLSYIGGISLLPLIFLYLSSYTFKFCSYHRMFLHYVSVNWVLNIYDYYIGISVSDKELLIMYAVVTYIFLFLILYFHQKCRKDGSLYR